MSDDQLKRAPKNCPYLEKCYRRNPIHFTEMSHPHLEKMVADQLDGDVKIPQSLEFPCSDRDLLADQLRILQSIFRKRRTIETDLSSSSSSCNKGITSTTEISAGLKAKVERNRQIALERRQKRLEKLDQEARTITNSLLTDGTLHHEDTVNGGTSDSMNDMRSRNINPSEEGKSIAKGSFVHGQKRKYEADSEQQQQQQGEEKEEEDVHLKESKRTNTQSECSSSHHKRYEGCIDQRALVDSQDQALSMRSPQSIFESYSTCRDSKTREKIRGKAIEMMRRQGHTVSLVEPGNFALKYAISAPYHLFFTRVEEIKKTYEQPYSISFPEILDKSLGEITSSLQINFMVDVGWLCLQYLLACQSPEMTILYGERVDTEKLPAGITMEPISTNNAFGCHHSKMMILKYKDDGIRVVVTTANLYSDDWDTRTQGIWISPHLPRLAESANTTDGESATGFRKDFERYLIRYQNPMLSEWLSYVRVADFSAVNVAFVSSVPGNHKFAEQDLWGHPRLGKILAENATLPPDAPQWPVIAQCSSIGSLGANVDSWLLKELVASMSRETSQGLKSQPNFKFIYPSLQNYNESLDSQRGSCCFPYSIKTHSKQPWLESYLYQWKAVTSWRDKAMPHIKTYTRLSPDMKRIPWFVLSSANLSKAAWGMKRSGHYILNYEAGVVFLPKFITGTTTFPIAEEEPGVPIFPIVYDLPLTKYGANDKPFVTEYLVAHSV